MTRFNPHAVWIFCLALMVAPHAARAAQSYDNCTGFITSVPAVVTTQGIWCLKQDLSTAVASGSAITINANNVTIDCNDFKLGGLAAGAGTTATGISATDRVNLTVRHCNIRGFEVGVGFLGATNTSSGGHAVEDSRFDGNTEVAIEVHGDGSVVRRNLVFNSGNSSVTANAFGIFAVYSVDVLDNTVSAVTARSGGNGSAYGIYTFGNSNGRINGNGIRSLVQDGTGKIYGIINVSSSFIAVRNNTLIGNGTVGSTGVYCETTGGSLRDNVIGAFATGRTICTDSGGNDIVP